MTDLHMDDQSSFRKLVLSAFMSPVFLYFEPYSVLVKAIGILVVIDIVTGLMSARKLGLDITSRQLFKKVPIVGLFLVALVAAKESSPLLAEFGIEVHQAGKWLCALYGVYELFSILENLGKLGLPLARQFSELMKSKLPDDIKTIVTDSSQSDNKPQV